MNIDTLLLTIPFFLIVSMAGLMQFWVTNEMPWNIYMMPKKLQLFTHSFNSKIKETYLKSRL